LGKGRYAGRPLFQDFLQLQLEIFGVQLDNAPDLADWYKLAVFPVLKDGDIDLRATVRRRTVIYSVS
jgi:hypothetical protein